jgi:hypothetical protein
VLTAARSKSKIANSCDKIIGKSSLIISAKAGWSWGCVSAVDSRGRTIFVVDAHRDDGKHFVVRADERLAAFVELELAIQSGKTPRGLRNA